MAETVGFERAGDSPGLELAADAMSNPCQSTLAVLLTTDGRVTRLLGQKTTNGTAEVALNIPRLYMAKLP